MTTCTMDAWAPGGELGLAVRIHVLGTRGDSERPAPEGIPAAAIARMQDLSPQLIDRALDGERAALEALAETLLVVADRRLPRVLYRRARHVSGDSSQEFEQLKYDIVEDLLYRYPNALRRWNPREGLSFLSYFDLFADGWLRRRLKTVRGSPWALKILAGAANHHEEATDTVPSRAMALDEEVALRVELRRGLSELDDDERTLLMAYYIEGKTAQELADAHAVRINSIHQRLSRIRRKVSAILQAPTKPAAVQQRPS